MAIVRKITGIRFYVFLLGLFFASCGSDKQGDEIGTIKPNEYPESYEVRNNEVFLANKINGPEDKSETPGKIATSWTNYSSGSLSRLAILLTDTNTSWLGLAHGLKSIGIPFIITTDYRKALDHKVVIVYPIVSGAVLSPDALQALAAFPRNGGTLIGIQVLGGLNEIFGFEEPIPSKQRFEIIAMSDEV